MGARARTLRYFGMLVLLYLATHFSPTASAQVRPGYSFATFDKNYDTLLSAARSAGYQVKEEEINSPYGKFSLRAEKAEKFYKEELFLFFNEKKELISLTARFNVLENQSKEVLDRLVGSIKEKLVQKYGPSERQNYPYFKLVENKYEVVVKPRQYFSASAESAFRELARSDTYKTYYVKEVQRLENEAISKTVNNF
jgi:hypothetical protein